MERFSDVESMKFVRIGQSSEHREFSIRKVDESCHDDDWESQEDMKVKLELERVYQLHWWRNCKEPLRHFEDAFEKTIPYIVKPLES